MPKETKILVEKRLQSFLEHCKMKRQKSRMDVYMENLKSVSNKEIYDLDEEDVLKFLIYKDVNNSGRTLVHHSQCPNLGTKSNDDCLDKVKCGFRHQSESMRVGIVDKLRKAFEDVGRKGPYDSVTLLGDPTRGPKINKYLFFKRQEQGMSGVLPEQAKHLSKAKMDSLMLNMYGKILGMKKGVRRLKVKQRRAMYAYCFSVIKRLAGAGHVISPNTIRIPNNGGLVFNCTWDKTLTMGSHCFGIICVSKKEPWCAHCIIDEWVKEAKSFGMRFDKGLLFPKINPDGTAHMRSRWKAKDLTETLKRDLESFKLYEGETPHSFRHGGTANALKKGLSLEETMYLAYMRNIQTAQRYSRGLRVLFPNFKWEDVGIGSAEKPVDEDTLMKQMISWKAFSDDNVPL